MHIRGEPGEDKEMTNSAAEATPILRRKPMQVPKTND